MSSEKDTNQSQGESPEVLGQAELGGDLIDENGRSIDAVYHVPVRISAVLGKAMMPVNQLLKLTRGSVVELDRRVGEPVDVFVNDRLVARGEVVIVEDRLGITMTEIVRS
jgi:flagellar motor switch protein FliN/FliY